MLITNAVLLCVATRALRRFVLLAVALYLIWFFSYENWVLPDGRLNSLLSDNIAVTAAQLLRVLGFPASIAPNDSILIMMGPQKAVYVGDYCNGLLLYALFMGFVLAYPGPVRRKVWFIPAGILAIYLLNVVRVAYRLAHRMIDFVVSPLPVIMLCPYCVGMFIRKAKEAYK